ncbi:transglutaminase domain-containing protein [Thermophilibacter provencensis]|uniref:Transglutaminase domain-containing protein n=1 Tax=Thermophilibacter provencensis TaxID=1852386 RepID=A0ABT7V0Z7_9ACTN|nr:transglutaminase domain-containing protein [Thermophilibacter provencensis]MDM8270287.1 transglutaminase domain-containing protein [Thermophilibacter provencensis]
MSLSAELIAYAAARHDARRPLLGEKDREVEALLAPLSADEAALMRYLVATLPLTDVFDTPLEVLLAHVRHALMLREGPAAGLPEDVFVHYVACPRVNNEPLDRCREALWEELAPRVAGLDAEHAVIEVNYWCAEMATYQITDGRTLGALGVVAGAAGRCGEESTLLVSALRSVGIPARQLYVPWWAHCDDNHAWVEAYANGAWHYLGACEPEEALDRGWFTAASGRAPMVATRLFSDFGCSEKDVVGRIGCTVLVNVTQSYAATTHLCVRVTLPDGTPAAGAAVAFEVLNMAGWRPLCVLCADAKGRCEVELGHGSVRAHASLGDLVAEMDVDAAGVADSEVELRLAPAATDGAWHDLDVRAPEDHPAPTQALSPEQAARGRVRKAVADESRAMRVAAMRSHAAQLARQAALVRPDDDAELVAQILDAARGNADAIYDFLTAGAEPERLALLSGLAEKDYLDARPELLEGHLRAALAAPRRHDLDAKTWERFALCPRIGLEHLSAWRPALPGALPEELSELVRTSPAAAWAWLREHLSFSPAEHLAKLAGTPIGALASGEASDVTLRTLFVAACRSLGVPARLAPADGRAEVLLDGRWSCMEGALAAEKTFELRLVAPEGRALVYGTDWGLARLGAEMQVGGQVLYGFHQLELWGCDPAELEVPAGTYRLTTTVRLPNGNQQASELVFSVSESTEVELRLREPKPEDMLQRIALPDAAPLVGGAGGLALVAFLEPAEEPTEHLLNELVERADDVAAAGLSVTLLTRREDSDDNTLSRALGVMMAAGADAKVAHDDFSELPERLARRMFANPELLPLAILLDLRGEGAPVGLFARGGYAVGTVDLVLRLAALA